MKDLLKRYLERNDGIFIYSNVEILECETNGHLCEVKFTCTCLEEKCTKINLVNLWDVMVFLNDKNKS